MNWSRIVPGTARSLVAGERPVIRSDGTPERDYIHVDDAVDAYLTVAASLQRPELRGRAWNAGSGTALSAREVVDRLIGVSGHEVEPDVQGAGKPPRRDPPPVPGLHADPRGAGLGAAAEPGRRAGRHVEVVRAAAGGVDQPRFITGLLMEVRG